VTLEQAGLTTPEQRREFERAWSERAADPTSRLFLPPQIDVVGIKPNR
jgi:hypothetical protein